MPNTQCHEVLPCNRQTQPTQEKDTFKDAAELYGHRPQDPRVWCLSPYEFVMYWEVCLSSYPLFLEDEHNPDHHVSLTPSGREKLGTRNSDLQPGVDYMIKEAGIDGHGRERLP